MAEGSVELVWLSQELDQSGEASKDLNPVARGSVITMNKPFQSELGWPTAPTRKFYKSICKAAELLVLNNATS